MISFLGGFSDAGLLSSGMYVTPNLGQTLPVTHEKHMLSTGGDRRALSPPRDTRVLSPPRHVAAVATRGALSTPGDALVLVSNNVI